MSSKRDGGDPPAHQKHPTEAKQNCSKWILIPSVVVLAIALLLAWNYTGFELLQSDQVKNVDLGEFTLELLRKFDVDKDEKLDADEFQSAAQYLLSLKPTDGESTTSQSQDYDFENTEVSYDAAAEILDANLTSGATVTIQASMEPTVTSTMSKSADNVAFYNEDRFSMFKNWTAPNVPTAVFPTSQFSVFLPREPIEKVVGKPYHIIGTRASKHDQRLVHGRIWPPYPRSDAEKLVFKLLGMFHPRPFISTRFGPRGSIACVRAYNKDLIDVVFRIHAEFQLNVSPLHPFWFTPAQFAGNILMKRDGTEVMEFSLFLPTEKKLNIDMEWITGIRENYTRVDDKYTMEVDIGFMPELRLRSDPEQHTMNAVNWDNEISVEEATSIIEKEFYPFKNVDYVRFNESAQLAKEEDKLVHVVLLWGSLDDQSC